MIIAPMIQPPLHLLQPIGLSLLFPLVFVLRLLRHDLALAMQAVTVAQVVGRQNPRKTVAKILERSLPAETVLPTAAAMIDHEERVRKMREIVTEDVTVMEIGMDIETTEETIVIVTDIDATRRRERIEASQRLLDHWRIVEQTLVV